MTRGRRQACANVYPLGHSSGTVPWSLTRRPPFQMRIDMIRNMPLDAAWERGTRGPACRHAKDWNGCPCELRGMAGDALGEDSEGHGAYSELLASRALYEARRPGGRNTNQHLRCVPPRGGRTRRSQSTLICAGPRYWRAASCGTLARIHAQAHMYPYGYAGKTRVRAARLLVSPEDEPGMGRGRKQGRQARRTVPQVMHPLGHICLLRPWSRQEATTPRPA